MPPGYSARLQSPEVCPEGRRVSPRRKIDAASVRGLCHKDLEKELLWDDV